MKKIVSWISALALLTVAMAFPASAAEVEVEDAKALVEAVKNANEGDVIKVYPGDYNIPQDETTTVQGQTGWYLPIEASGITIVGVDENGNEITDAANAAANLYSTDYSANGSWPTQNLITVFGDNVTMKGLVIMNKIDANKSIEVYADGFTIENCTFASIAEGMLEGRNPEDLGGYVYDEYKEYGASLYFNAHANAVVKNNIFQNSNLTLSEDLTGTMEITGNTFSGVKNWKNDPEYTYSAIGYTSWAKPPVTDISGADITIEENKFENAGTINFSKVETGSVDVSNNYWGGEAPAQEKLLGPVTVENYYKNIDETTGDPIDLVTLPDEEDVVDGEVVFVQNGTKVDIYLEGRFDGQPALISNFVAAEFTIETAGDLAVTTIEPGEGLVIVPQGDGYYLFHKQEDGADLSGDSIKLGTITLGGFGEGTISVDGTGKMQRRIADSVVYSGEVTGETTDLNLAQETVKLTINVAFNNNITAGNTVDYNDFTITVKDAKGKEIVYKLGKSTNEGEFAVHYVDDYTAQNATIEAEVIEGYRYSIEAQGAGYRTYRTSVLADGDKTVNLWNNVKDAEAEVTTGVSTTKNFLAGDIVMDNVINLYDLSAVVSYFGQKGIDVEAASNYAQYDLNRDGKIDSKDVAMVLVSWEE